MKADETGDWLDVDFYATHATLPVEGQTQRPTFHVKEESPNAALRKPHVRTVMCAVASV